MTPAAITRSCGGQCCSGTRGVPSCGVDPEPEEDGGAAGASAALWGVGSAGGRHRVSSFLLLLCACPLLFLSDSMKDGDFSLSIVTSSFNPVSSPDVGKPPSASCMQLWLDRSSSLSTVTCTWRRRTSWEAYGPLDTPSRYL